MSDLVDRLPPNPSPDDILEAFVDWAADRNLELYPAQEEAILEGLAGNNVILNTPTGSGKSLVALAGHLHALANGKRSFYTAPIKALVSEKFFALARDLGAENVGMMTGDASVNADAPIICCTQEVLANLALRDGDRAIVDHVVVDEFHFYSDPDRGWAWQVPLIELPQATFLLMSATLGKTNRFETELTKRTGRPTALVQTVERPVPLDFEYRTTTLLDSIEALLEQERSPVYVVHFTQRDAIERAQALTSLAMLSKDEKKAISDAIGGFRFDSPFGKDLSRFIRMGVGVHHAGLLPKYRLLVERLAQEGLLKLICGTDTLGVGVNVPIRTVLFTQLCKYDGTSNRVLSVREFKQIAGRAGRKGFDDLGTVWAQAPEHVAENLKNEQKAEGDAKKQKKLRKKKPPERGYSHWDEQTFNKLVNGDPEELTSSFDVSHAMMLHLLDRPGDGCGAVKHLLSSIHEPRKQQRRHARRAIQLYRSLRDGGTVEVLDEPDDQGRLVRVDRELQADFAMNQPLSPFVLTAVGRLREQWTSELGEAPAGDDINFALDALTMVESVLENPRQVLMAQQDKERTAEYERMRSEGVEYDERQEKLAEVTYPKPLADFVYETFNVWSAKHPWVGQDNVQPKSIVRDLFEKGMTFREYVSHYGLRRSEGVLLRYLSDVYKALMQNIPEDDKTDAIYDVTEWIGALVRQVDSSLIDEWERMVNPPDEVAAGGEVRPPEAPDITKNVHAFSTMIRTRSFRWVERLARRRYQDLAADLAEVATDRREAPSMETLADQAAPYWESFDSVGIDAAARGGRWFVLDTSGTDAWKVEQVLVDPEGYGEWRIDAAVNLAESRERGEPVIDWIGVRKL